MERFAFLLYLIRGSLDIAIYLGSYVYFENKLSLNKMLYSSSSDIAFNSIPSLHWLQSYSGEDAAAGKATWKFLCIGFGLKLWKTCCLSSKVNLGKGAFKIK